MSDINKNITFPRDLNAEARARGRCLVAYGIDDSHKTLKQFIYMTPGDARCLTKFMCRIATGDSVSDALEEFETLKSKQPEPDVHALLQRLWTAAVGKPSYNKAAMEAERTLQ